jgi:hypothetical protein
MLVPRKVGRVDKDEKEGRTSERKEERKRKKRRKRNVREDQASSSQGESEGHHLSISILGSAQEIPFSFLPNPNSNPNL